MILVVGLSPAWQRTLVFDHIVAGQVNRARHVHESASGKGVNVARVICQLGGQALLLTVAGGGRGRQLVAALRKQRIPTAVISVAAETRVCQTLLSAGPATELVEETGPLTHAEVAAAVARFQQELRRAHLVVLTGSVPHGCGDNLYEKLVRLTIARGLPVIVDAQRAQLVNVLRAEPALVKINRDELRAAGLTVADMHRQGVEWVVITSGPGPVEVSGPRERFSVQPPPLKVVNPIGSGDAFLAGIAVALIRKKTMAAAVRLGVACGAANALTPEPGTVRRVDVRRFMGGRV